MTICDALRYEIAASWWAEHISNKWLQEIAGRYFAWKVRRKWNRGVRRSRQLQEIIQRCELS